MVESMNCPNCELEIELHLSSATGEQVKEQKGDFGLCWDCGQSMMFDGEHMVVPDMTRLSAMTRLQLHWQWQRWNWKHSIRGN